MKIIKIWYVIVKKYNHLNSDLTGVLYLNVDINQYPNSGLKIFNLVSEIEIYKDDHILFKPKENDLIISIPLIWFLNQY